MKRRLSIAVLLLVGVYLMGAVGYKALSPHESFVDCVYMSVITVASVGFSEVIDSTHRVGLRVYTMILILFGVGVQVYSVSAVTAFIVEGDLSQYFWKRRMRKRIEGMTRHFVVCGAGETGLRVVDELVRTRRDFVVIDPDERAIQELQKSSDLAVVQGQADDEQTLEAAGIRRAAAAAVALGSDRDNLVATLSIRTMNPQLRIVVEECEPGMATRLRRAGADAIVNPATIGGLRLVSEMVRPSVVSFLDLMLRDPAHVYRIEEIAIPLASPWANRPLTDLALREAHHLLVAAVRLADSTDFTYIPPETWVVEAGQSLIVLGKAEDVQSARHAAELGAIG